MVAPMLHGFCRFSTVCTVGTLDTRRSHVTIPSAYTGLFSVCRCARGHGQALMSPTPSPMGDPPLVPQGSSPSPTPPEVRLLPMVLLVTKEEVAPCIRIRIAPSPTWGFVDILAGMAVQRLKPFLPFILFIRCVLSSPVRSCRCFIARLV